MDLKNLIKISFLSLIIGLSIPSQISAKEKGMSKQVVAIVDIKAKWYYFDFLLKNGFRNSIPEYEAAPGLLFKYYDFIHKDSQKEFGGIYLWKDIESAEKWYDNAWFDRIYQVEEIKTFVPDNFDYRSIEGDSIAAYFPQISENKIEIFLTKAPGILRSYILKKDQKNYAVVLFENKDSAEEFILNHNLIGAELYSTPVLLKN
jgi:hypothetical protein